MVIVGLAQKRENFALMQPTPQTIGPQTHLLCRGDTVNCLLDHELTSAPYTRRNFADAFLRLTAGSGKWHANRHFWKFSTLWRRIKHLILSFHGDYLVRATHANRGPQHQAGPEPGF
jgi:hypothetical protein